MKLKYMIPLLFPAYTASAQLTVTAGAQFLVNGDVPLTLHNMDIINNGILAGGVNTTSFTGDASSSISGNGTLRFFKLEVNKSGNQSVVLQKSIDIVNSLLFTSGFLNLNGFNVDLETSGRVDGENNNNRIIGLNGGQVLLRTTLDAPLNINPGNLGIVITSNQNLGQVTIKRGHQSQVGTGLSSSILRYYEISPDNNSNLNATLRFNYFDGELNGINENTLVFFKSDNVTDWSVQGFNLKDAASNFVEKNNLASLSRWTLSSLNTPLPVLFSLFNLSCEHDKVLIRWKTAQEQNSDHFNIERSSDGTHWSVIGSLPGTGSAGTETSYSFTNNSAGPNDFYRIAEYDFSEGVHLTSIMKSPCSVTDAFNIWPNPANDQVSLNIVTANASLATVHVFDSKGALIKVQKINLLQGSNLFNVDVRSIPRGIYHIEIDWNNGQLRKTAQVMKQ